MISPISLMILLISFMIAPIIENQI